MGKLELLPGIATCSTLPETKSMQLHFMKKSMFLIICAWTSSVESWAEFVVLIVLLDERNINVVFLNVSRAGYSALVVKIANSGVGLHIYSTVSLVEISSATALRINSSAPENTPKASKTHLTIYPSTRKFWLSPHIQIWKDLRDIVFLERSSQDWNDDHLATEHIKTNNSSLSQAPYSRL